MSDTESLVIPKLRDIFNVDSREIYDIVTSYRRLLFYSAQNNTVYDDENVFLEWLLAAWQRIKFL